MVDHKDALIYHAAEFSKIYYITLNNLLNLLGANWGIMLWPSSWLTSQIKEVELSGSRRDNKTAN